MGLQLRRALDIVLQTKPYILHRALMYGALCLCVIAYLLLLAIIGAVFGAGAFWVLLVLSALLAVLLGITGFIGEYVFYRLKAGHIALMTEIISEGRFPSGISQTKWARGHVLHYFKGVGLLAEVRQMLREILRAMNRTLFDSSTVLPVPGMEGGMRCARRIVDVSQGYIEEALIAHAFKARHENPFTAIRTALVLYCQSWKVVLGDAVSLTLLSYGFTLLATVVFLVPLGFLAHGVDHHAIIRFILFAIGVFMGFSAKWAFFDPIACAAIALTFLKESELLTPDPAWEDRIESVAAQFKELKKRAADMPAEPQPETGPTAGPTAFSAK